MDVIGHHHPRMKRVVPLPALQNEVRNKLRNVRHLEIKRAGALAVQKAVQMGEGPARCQGVRSKVSAGWQATDTLLLTP